jgi:transcriptional regulator with XRE-family HTH domain
MQDEYRDILKRGLTEKGWTYAEFARRIGVTRGAVQKWLVGQGKPDKKLVPKIAAEFNLVQMQLWRFYADTPEVIPTWETMMVADLFRVPPGTSPEVVDLVLAQLQLAFPDLCVAATAAIAAMQKAQIAQRRELVQTTVAAQQGDTLRSLPPSIPEADRHERGVLQEPPEPLNRRVPGR